MTDPPVSPPLSAVQKQIMAYVPELTATEASSLTPDDMKEFLDARMGSTGERVPIPTVGSELLHAGKAVGSFAKNATLAFAGGNTPAAYQARGEMAQGAFGGGKQAATDAAGTFLVPVQGEDNWAGNAWNAQAGLPPIDTTNAQTPEEFGQHAQATIGNVEMATGNPLLAAQGAMLQNTDHPIGDALAAGTTAAAVHAPGAIRGGIAATKLAFGAANRGLARVQRAVQSEGGIPAVSQDLYGLDQGGAGDNLVVGDLGKRGALRDLLQYSAKKDPATGVALNQMNAGRMGETGALPNQRMQSVLEGPNGVGTPYAPAIEHAMDATRNEWARPEFGEMRNTGTDIPVDFGAPGKPAMTVNEAIAKGPGSPEYTRLMDAVAKGEIAPARRGEPIPGDAKIPGLEVPARPPNEMAKLLNQPIVSDAMKRAGMTARIGVNPATTPEGMLSFSEAMDIYQSLDDEASKAFAQGANNRGARLAEVRKELGAQMGELDSRFKKLNAKYEMMASQRDAMVRGAKDGLNADAIKLGRAETPAAYRAYYDQGVQATARKELLNSSDIAGREFGATAPATTSALREALPASTFNQLDAASSGERRMAQMNDVSLAPDAGTAQLPFLSSPGWMAAKVGAKILGKKAEQMTSAEAGKLLLQRGTRGSMDLLDQLQNNPPVTFAEALRRAKSRPLLTSSDAPAAFAAMLADRQGKTNAP